MKQMGPKHKPFAAFPKRSKLKVVTSKNGYSHARSRNGIKHTLKRCREHADTAGNKTAVTRSMDSKHKRSPKAVHNEAPKDCLPTVFVNLTKKGEMRGEMQPTTYCFTRLLSRSNVAGGFFFYLPKNFCSDILERDTDLFLEDESGRKWPVRFLHPSSGRKVRGLSGGWGKFAKHHGLKAGEEIAMELVQPRTTPLTFKVKLTGKPSSSDKPDLASVSAGAEENIEQTEMMDDKEEISRTKMDFQCVPDSRIYTESEVRDEVVESDDPKPRNSPVGDNHQQTLEIAPDYEATRRILKAEGEDQEKGRDPLISLTFANNTYSKDVFPEKVENEEDGSVVSVDLIRKPLSRTTGEADDKLQILTCGEKNDDDGLLIGHSDEQCQMLLETGDNDQKMVNQTAGLLEESVLVGEEKEKIGDGDNQDKVTATKKDKLKSRGLDLHLNLLKTNKKSFKRTSESAQTTSPEKLHKRKGRARGQGLGRGFKLPEAEVQTERSSTSGIDSDYPCFEKVLTRGHTVKGFFMSLPSEFCDTHLSKNTNMVQLEDEEGKRWEVVYLHRRKGLSGGWRGFALDHKLKVGDTAAFSLVDHSTFKVSIIPKAGHGDSKKD